MYRRVAIIGPHRRRTGTGPFVAEFLRQAGWSVLGWDRDEARRRLAPGSPAPEVDAVAICSPAETHLDYLVGALGHRRHVFSEKPILWPRDHSSAAFPGLIATLAQTLDSARRDRMVVHENTQWVYTLKDFRYLAGDFAPEDVKQFRCELAPSSGTAPEMIMECSAHANSLLIGLGCSGIEDLRMGFQPAGSGRGAALDIAFRSRGPCHQPVEAEYHFAQQMHQPRPAAYAINGQRLERRVDLNGYRVFLRCGLREQAIRDPLQSSVEDFLKKISGPAPQPDPAIVTNIRMSSLLLSACPRPPVEAANA